MYKYEGNLKKVDQMIDYNQEVTFNATVCLWRIYQKNWCISEQFQKTYHHQNLLSIINNSPSCEKNKIAP